MTLQLFAARSIPLGSGSVESAIRRVVNMRMKGNGTFWRRDNAEIMLLLRSYLKAGRLDDLFPMVHFPCREWVGGVRRCADQSRRTDLMKPEPLLWTAPPSAPPRAAREVCARNSESPAID